MDTITSFIKTAEALAQLKKEHFFTFVLGSPQWWLLVAMFILPWLVFLFLLKPSKQKGLMATGIIAALITIIMDDIGIHLSLWTYPYPLTYWTGFLVPVDLAVVPVFFMLVYQYASSWKAYLIVVVLFSLFAALIAEPIYDAIHIAVLIDWHYLYSTPFYIGIGIVAKWLADGVGK